MQRRRKSRWHAPRRQEKRHPHQERRDGAAAVRGHHQEDHPARRHAGFFSSINPAAWLFSALFVAQGVLFVWFGVLHDRLRFSPLGSPRHTFAWVFIVYALLYPLLAHAGGHTFPRMPTYGVPCPTTLLTIGFLFAADPPVPRLIAVIPITWAFIGGSAALFLGVRADLMGVFRRVAVRRVIATVGATAFLARPQVNPRRGNLDAFLAYTPLRPFDCRDSIDMRAGLGGHLR